jgi:SAM-dependent methyltransferase
MNDQLSIQASHASPPEFGATVQSASAEPIYANLPRAWRYLAIAAVCAVVANISLIILAKSGINYLVAVWIVYLPTLFLAYELHARITFQVDRSFRAFIRYAVANLATYPLWIASLVILRSGLKLPIEIAAPIGTIVAFAGNYVGTHWAILRSVRSAFSHGWRELRPMSPNLLVQFLSEYAFQPATAFWRAIEVPALIDLGVPLGRGLDLGCGEGKLTAILLGIIGSRELVGVDTDLREIEEARLRNVYVALHACGGSEIPEPDASFDFAISNSVLEHIPELDPVLAETARVLRPNGLFLLTVPQASFHAQLRGPLMPWISRNSYLANLDQRLAHLRYPSAAAWQEMLDRHGFITEETMFYLNRSEVRRWETISRLTAGVLNALSGGRLHPIVLQRRMGFRQAQNRIALPFLFASVISALITFGLRRSCAEPSEANTGCVAIRCRRR